MLQLETLSVTSFTAIFSIFDEVSATFLGYFFGNKYFDSIPYKGCSISKLTTKDQKNT